jgi:hypothetical protein
MLAKQVLVALAALGPVSAAVLPRQEESPITSGSGYEYGGNFQIASFTASRPQYSIMTTYSLEMTDVANTASPANITTTCRYDANTQPGIVGFQTQYCEDQSVKWSLVNNGTGFILTLAHNWGLTVDPTYLNITDTALAFFPDSDVKTNDTTQSAFLEAPQAFTMPYSRYSS